MGVGIGLGCAEFPFSGAAAYWRWVDMCEAGGVDSIWQTDRMVSRQPILECMTTMAALAGRTRRMRFGMNVVSLALRDPVLLAKQCATIDVLSEGRLLPAFGIGSPLAPEWQALGIDTKTRGRKTDECLEIIRRLWREERVDFERRLLPAEGRHHLAEARAARPADVDRRLVGGRDPAHGAHRHRLAGRRRPAGRGRSRRGRDQGRRREAGRSIDEDHYGASFPFHFGSRDAPGVGKAMDAYAKRTGRDATHAFAIGDADTILARIAEYVDAGVSKFILRPLGGDDDTLLAQTRQLIEQVLPRAEARWPKRPKTSDL